MVVIGITGYMGSGKDEIGKILVENCGFEHTSFAFPLRREVAECIKAGAFPPSMPEWMAQYLKNCEVSEVWEKPTTEAMRKILQWYGTDYRRAEDEDYWVKAWARSLDPKKKYTVTDVRFPNEADIVVETGGAVWRVTGDRSKPYGIHGHASEKFINSLPVTVVITNNKKDSLDDLRERVIDAYRLTMKNSMEKVE